MPVISTSACSVEILMLQFVLLDTIRSEGVVMIMILLSYVGCDHAKLEPNVGMFSSQKLFRQTCATAASATFHDIVKEKLIVLLLSHIEIPAWVIFEELILSRELNFEVTLVSCPS